MTTAHDPAPGTPADAIAALTPRQRQVLELVARGRTNAEIGKALGITLDGAKWHVSEVISRLGVDTREEAADLWRQYNGLPARLRRVVEAVIGGGLLLRAAGAAAVLALLAAGAFALAALLDDETPGATPDITETATAAASPDPSPTPDTSPSPSATQVPATQITGLFTEPRPLRADRVVTLDPPVSPFPPWDGQSAVIYDTETLTHIDLGPGSTPWFSPDGTMAVWIAGESPFAGGLAMVIELSTGAIHSLGEARGAAFEDNQRVVLDGALVVNLLTGERGAGQLTREWWLPAEPPGDYRLRVVEDLGPPLERGGSASRLVELAHRSTGTVQFRFAAFAAVVADADTVAVATPPVGRLTNIFLVSIASGSAQFVGTAEISSPNWPFSASDRHVLWTDAYCTDPVRRRTLLYSRESASITEVRPAGWMGLAQNGLIQVGEFNGGAMLDPDSLSYAIVIPGNHVSWSAGFRYAAQGQFGGHGGLC